MGTEATRPPKSRRRGSRTWFGASSSALQAQWAASCGRRRTGALWRAAPTSVGRKSGRERSVIIGYVEDGPNLVVLAMNGWDEGHHSWWLNLEAHPDAVVRLAGQHARPGCALPVMREERDRQWPVGDIPRDCR